MSRRGHCAYAWEGWTGSKLSVGQALIRTGLWSGGLSCHQTPPPHSPDPAQGCGRLPVHCPTLDGAIFIDA